MSFSEFFLWVCTGPLEQFYENIRWPGWENDVATLHGDRCYNFVPPLWTKDESGRARLRREVPVAEAWEFQMEMRRQLADLPDGASVKFVVRGE